MGGGIEMEKNIALIILAAGASKRMGKIKQLLPWKKTFLLGHVIEQAKRSETTDVFVVLGAQAEKIIPEIKSFGITTLMNADWTSGLGSSIACAVDHIEKNYLNYDAILIALADQPLIDTLHFNTLIRAMRQCEKNIIATQFSKGVGVPAIFKQKYFKQLSALHKDKGAKGIIEQFKEDVYLIKASWKTGDVDTKGSYEQLFGEYGKS